MAVSAPSRAASQERTRQRLLDAAGQRFERDGYFGTSLAQIAADADLTKGAVYANFESKADLFQAVRQDWSLRGLRELVAALEGVSDLDVWIDLVSDWVATLGGESDRHLSAYAEFLVEAASTAATAAASREPYRANRALVAQLVTAELARVSDIEVDPDRMGTHIDVFLATLAGLGVTRRLDPEISVETYGAALRNLIAGALATTDQR